MLGYFLQTKMLLFTVDRKTAATERSSLPCALIKINGVVAVQLNLLVISSNVFTVEVVFLFNINWILERWCLRGKHGPTVAATTADIRIYFSVKLRFAGGQTPPTFEALSVRKRFFKGITGVINQEKLKLQLWQVNPSPRTGRLRMPTAYVMSDVNTGPYNSS